jgi:integrase
MKDPGLRYFLIAPSPKRAGFTLVGYKLKDRRTKEYFPIPNEAKAQVREINKKIKSGVLTVPDARLLLEGLIEQLTPKARSAALRASHISTVNQKLFNEYWDKVYSSRFLEDEGQSMKYDLQKALRLIEPLSLATATPAEILAQLKKSCKSVKVMRRAIDRLNQFMKFLKKPVLPKPKPGLAQVDYLTEAQFKLMLKHVSGDMKALLATLFATGLRLSEALALTSEDVGREHVKVMRQLTKNGLKPPKRGKSGDVLILPQYKTYVDQWAKVQDKGQFRYSPFNELQRACVLAKVKVIGIHDLRHSHAIYLLGKGASLKMIALNLRNRQDVCEQYYLGFAHTDETLEGLKKLVQD